MGLKLSRGEGTGQDAALAAGWFRKSAEQGYPEAQYRLGAALWSGEGVATNRAEALSWYGKAAAQMDADALYVMGLNYYTGQNVAKDPILGAAFFMLAETAGHPLARQGISIAKKELSPQAFTLAMNEAKRLLVRINRQAP
jgi:TPR repeat protein